MNPTAQDDRAVAIGIDIGATTTRVGLVMSSVRLLSQQAVATPDSTARMTTWLSRAIDELRAAHEANPVVAVGLAVPGLVETDTGRVTRCVRLPCIEGNWLAQSLSAHTGHPVVLATDIDAAALSERLALASAPVRFAHLRLGTGVGLGVTVDGKPQPIEPGRTTHASVLVVDERPDAARCACGLRGCLEMVAGGEAMMSDASSLGLDGLPALQRACDRQEPAVLAVVDAAAKAVTRAVENIHRRYRSEVLVLGGGVIEHLPALYERTAELFSQSHVSEHVSHGTIPSTQTLRVDRTQFGDAAGIIGAAQLADARRCV